MTLGMRFTIVALWAGMTVCTCTAGLCGDPPRVAVPATDEITLLDPRVSADGKPTPIVITRTDGQPIVDIPPTVIVHNFYYTGDRDFRGPRMPGGPSIVVVSHPDTGERLYLDVQMLPGAPRVIYKKDQIEYEFGHGRIRIHFSNSKLFGCDKAKVSYVKGSEKVLQESSKSDKSLTGSKGKSTKAAVKKAIAGADLAVEKVGQAIKAPVVAVVQATPLGALFADPTEAIATEQRNISVEQAAAQADQLQLTIPTNR